MRWADKMVGRNDRLNREFEKLICELKKLRGSSRNGDGGCRSQVLEQKPLTLCVGGISGKKVGCLILRSV